MQQSFVLERTRVVSDEELRTITVDYTVEFARVFRGSSPGGRVFILERRRRGSDGTQSAGIRAF
jgi:hypothetical protein